MRGFFATGLAVATFLFGGNALAAFHEMRIVEVVGGPGSYVMLQMYSPNQNFTAGHSIVVYDTSDNVLQTLQLQTVANGDDNAYILIGTTGTLAQYGVMPDFNTLVPFQNAGGKVCFDPAASAIDCFSWGTYPARPGATGGSTGSPFAALSATNAAKRKVNGGTVANELDPADDTQNCFADFAFGTPAPKNNTRIVPDAGTSTSSSSSSSSTSSSSSSSSSSSGSTSSSSSSTSSGVGTNPSSSSSTSSGAVAPAAAPAEDDGGCSTTGDTGALTAAPLLALAAILAAAKRRRR